MIFCEPNKRVMLNLKCVLMNFHAVSRLSINVTKFEMVKLKDERDTNNLTRIMCCKVVKLPTKYMGLPLGANFKEVGTWDSLMTRFEKRLARWKRAFLS